MTVEEKITEKEKRKIILTGGRPTTAKKSGGTTRNRYSETTGSGEGRGPNNYLDLVLSGPAEGLIEHAHKKGGPIREWRESLKRGMLTNLA